MLYNKHAAKMLERQQSKKTRQVYHALAELNLSLNQIHKSIEHYIDHDKYKYATEYVDQYISYTTVWNLKFVYNLENPEVALLQIFHLTYIFENEHESNFMKERRELELLKEQFAKMNPFKQEKVEERYAKMVQFILARGCTLKNTEQ
jgi:ribulose bisphosphate carboxylase small subunit